MRILSCCAKAVFASVYPTLVGPLKMLWSSGRAIAYLIVAQSDGESLIGTS
jgi:hypothetical protein